MTHTALVLVDIQNDYFAQGRAPVSKMEEAAAAAAALLERARKQGVLVVHVRHEIKGEGAPFFAEGSPGAQIHVAVAPITNENVVVKNRPNSFHGTDLEQILRDAGIRNLVVCGAMSQMCIDATTRAAVDFGYKVTVAQDACGAKEMAFDGVSLSAAQVHAAFMAPLAMSYAKVQLAEECLRD